MAKRKTATSGRTTHAPQSDAFASVFAEVFGEARGVKPRRLVGTRERPDPEWLDGERVSAAARKRERRLARNRALMKN